MHIAKNSIFVAFGMLFETIVNTNESGYGDKIQTQARSN